MIHGSEQCHTVTYSLSNDKRRLETRMPTLPVVFLWRPQSPASQRSQNFFHSSSHIIPHPPFLLHRPSSPLFSLLSVNPPRPDYEVGGTSPSSFTPIKFTVRKGGRRGCAVVETSISDNCFWQVEQVIRRL